MTTPISSESLLGIVPIDEDAPTTMPEVISKKKEEMAAIETRKSKDDYENQREREAEVDYA